MKKQLLTVAATAGLLFTSFGTASAHENTYTVKSGDSLWAISRNNNVTVDQLKQWNNLSTSTIYVNQKLSLLAPHSHETSSTYTVKSGDTLWRIASAHGMTVTQLKSLNGLTSDVIVQGQTLLVAGSATPAPATPAPATSTYVVKSGDSLWAIATRYNLTVTELKSLNNLTTNTIYVGQVLKVTGTATTAPAPAPAPVETVSKVDQLIAEAKKYIGVPYLWGGSTPSGFDCSGYLNYVYAKVGISIPRTVDTIWSATKPVSAPKVGDLVFFETYKPGPSHAGIYLGDNKFIHSSSSNGVTISDMNNTYWKPRYLGAKTTF